MFDLEKWREIFQSIVSNKLRTLLTATGVIWAVFMCIFMYSGESGLKNGIMKNMDGVVTNSFYVWGMRTTRPYMGMKAGRRVKFNNSDVTDVLANVSSVDLVVPRLNLGGYGENNNITRGAKSGSYSVKGDHPDYVQIQPNVITRGRWMNILDVEDRRKICVIGERVYEGLFDEGENPIGQSINIQGVHFTVVGTFRSAKTDESQMQEDLETIHVPYTTLQQSLTSQPERIHWFAMLAKEGIEASVAEEEVKSYLRVKKKIDPEDPMALGSWNTQAEFSKYQNMFLGIEVLVLIVGLGMLAAGVIGVMNIMLIAVKERTKEIGIRKAVGATPAKIIGMIIGEAVVITLLAGTIGVILGFLGNQLFEFIAQMQEQQAAGYGHRRRSFVMFASPNLDIMVYYITFVTLFISGILAGILPAIRAIQVNPIKALRSE